MAKGVKHYLPNGKEYKGATHKMNGQLHSGAKHTASSKVLKHSKLKKSLPKAQAGMIVKPTADSTAYYKDEAKFQSNLGVLQSKYGLRKQAEEAMAKSRKAYSNASRQKYKGKPGYDKNGFPIKKKG